MTNELPPSSGGGVFRMFQRGIDHYEGDFAIHHTPPSESMLSESPRIMLQKSNIHPLTDDAHKVTAKVISSKSQTASQQSVSFPNDSTRSDKAQAGMSVTDWIKSLNLQTQHKYHHDKPTPRGSVESAPLKVEILKALEKTQQTVKEDSEGQTPSVSAPSSPKLRAKLPRRPSGMLDMISQSCRLMEGTGSEESAVGSHGSTFDVIAFREQPLVEAAKSIGADKLNVDFIEKKSTQAVCSASEAVNTGKRGTLSNWLFKEEKKVGNKDVNVFSPTSF